MRWRQEEEGGEEEEEEGSVEGFAMSLLLVLWRGPVEKDRHVLLLASSLRVAVATASVADEERARREPQAKEGVRKARE